MFADEQPSPLYYELLFILENQGILIESYSMKFPSSHCSLPSITPFAPFTNAKQIINLNIYLLYKGQNMNYAHLMSEWIINIYYLV